MILLTIIDGKKHERQLRKRTQTTQSRPRPIVLFFRDDYHKYVLPREKDEHRPL